MSRNVWQVRAVDYYDCFNIVEAKFDTEAEAKAHVILRELAEPLRWEFEIVKLVIGAYWFQTSSSDEYHLR